MRLLLTIRRPTYLTFTTKTTSAFSSFLLVALFIATYGHTGSDPPPETAHRLAATSDPAVPADPPVRPTLRPTLRSTLRTLHVSQIPVCHNSCITAEPVSMGVTRADASCLAATIANPPLQYDCINKQFVPFPGNWFKFVTPAGGCSSAEVSVVTTGTSVFEASFVVYQGNSCLPNKCVAPTLGAQFDQTLAWKAEPGTTYYIVMFPIGSIPNFHTYDLHLTCA